MPELNHNSYSQINLSKKFYQLKSIFKLKWEKQKCSYTYFWTWAQSFRTLMRPWNAKYTHDGIKYNSY